MASDNWRAEFCEYCMAGLKRYIFDDGGAEHPTPGWTIERCKAPDSDDAATCPIHYLTRNTEDCPMAHKAETAALRKRIAERRKERTA